MLDLFSIAKDNALAIENEFKTILASLAEDQSAVVREFAAWVETTALPSLNVRLDVIEEIVRGGSYQNAYEWADERSRLSGRPAEEILKERLQGFYEKRLAFDSSFVLGKKFRYGALNAGRGGLTDYGPYCMVVARGVLPIAEKVAYLPGDSLKIGVLANGALDENAVRRAATPHSHRHLLVAIHRFKQLPGLKEPEWAKLVVSGDRYFEVIFIGDVSLKTLKYICVLKSEYDRMWDLAFANFSRKLNEAERAVVQDFIVLLRAAKVGAVRLEVVNEVKVRSSI